MEWIFLINPFGGCKISANQPLVLFRQQGGGGGGVSTNQPRLFSDRTRDPSLACTIAAMAIFQYVVFAFHMETKMAQKQKAVPRKQTFG